MSVVRELFSPAARRQRYLDVEAALADAQAEAGLIPAAAAAAIGAAARLELLDGDRLAAVEARTGHSMVALVTELSRVVGDPNGGWCTGARPLRTFSRPATCSGSARRESSRDDAPARHRVGVILSSRGLAWLR